MQNIQIGLAQLNYAVGDLSGNLEKIVVASTQFSEDGADLAVFSELCLTGYPPEDLILSDEFEQAVKASIQLLLRRTKDLKCGILLGTPWVESRRIYNAALLIERGQILHVHHKHDLPNYGVFDEKRLFSKGDIPAPLVFRGIKLGLMICEDMWNVKVAEGLKGSDLLISINGSPFEITKPEQRINYARMCCQRAHAPLIYVNQVGGQDDLVFDGDSFVISETGETLASLGFFAEVTYLSKWTRVKDRLNFSGSIKTLQIPNTPERIYHALVLALRDYVNKNKFPGVVIGLSGGVDSALAAAIACDALSPARVVCLMMPSKFTSKASIKDAEDCAKRLGVELKTIPITPMVKSFGSKLSKLFKGRKTDIAEENIQSRIRGNILMSYSNTYGYMVVATGNKSEFSAGYTTLYGDMCGGYAILKDVYKTQVYELSRYRNHSKHFSFLGADGIVIPSNILEKAPTAELKHDQTDQDTLPPYEVLDAILECMIEYSWPKKKIIESGFDAETVEKVFQLLTRAEFKRRQSPPGAKISSRPFGRDRRYPITNRFTGA